MQQQPVHRLVNLIPDDHQYLANLTPDGARALLLGPRPHALRELRGSFALVAREGERVRMARSLDRPMRFFLAKEQDGPLLVVADRIDAIQTFLAAQGYAGQFHPTYTRMVPAHHVTEIQLVGCPDPNPVYQRFFDPPRSTLPPDLDVIGTAYVKALRAEVATWLDFLPADEPIGVQFSGGVDSGAILLVLHDELLARGQSAQGLKAFTLAVAGGGADLAQARSFLDRTGLAFLGETIEVPAEAVDTCEAVRVIEDYKPLDVECAAVNLALFAGIRARYPEWRYLMDGDGGDENLKDYPIEENPELTIRSVVSNRMLYHEGWGVDAVKHSLTYSGGLSRGCVRGYAPARRYGFTTFSPNMAPAVIAVAEAIPFAELTAGSHEKLYALKGEVLSRGVRAVLGRELPVYSKRRFQRGAVPERAFAERFGGDPSRYRAHFSSLYQRV